MFESIIKTHRIVRDYFATTELSGKRFASGGCLTYVSLVRVLGHMFRSTLPQIASTSGLNATSFCSNYHWGLSCMLLAAGRMLRGEYLFEL